MGTSCSLCVALSVGVKQWVHLVLCLALSGGVKQ